MQLTKLLARLSLAAVLLSTLNLQLSTAHAQGTAFTYQGVLSQGGVAVSGSNDLTFTLYNAVSAGATVGTSNVVNDLVMTNGLFTVTLDFGAGAFDGSARWLQIAARPGASTGAYTNLAPRTPITPTPYAMFAGGASLAGTYGSAVNFSNAANRFSGIGSNLTALNASQLTNGTVPDARLSANVALRAGGNVFSGTQVFTNGNILIGTLTPLSILTVNNPGYGISHTDGSNIMATFVDDTGGWFGTASTDPLHFYVNNNAAPSMTVATSGNIGIGTTTPNNLLDVAVGGVIGNSTVLGLNIHDTLNRGSKVFFGYNVPGTEFNGLRAVVNPGLNGCGNSGDLLFYTWECNTAPTREVMRINGRGNVGIGTTSPMTSIGYPSSGWDGLHTRGPSDNGLQIIQGVNSARLHLRADNNITNVAQDFIMANGANRIDFMWLGSGLANRLLAMTIATNGNVGVAGEVTTTAVNITSDRNAKEQFKPVNAREVLAKVARLPISEWQYKTQSDARHIGPMAQDFREAFSLGRDEKHITSVDADGVALAAIQGLNEKFDEQSREKDTRIQELEKTVAELKELVSKLAAQKGGAR